MVIAIAAPAPEPDDRNKRQIGKKEKKEWDKILLETTLSGDIINFSNALKNKANVNCVHSFNGYMQYSPLHHAAENGYFNMVKKLVEHGANINAVISPISTAYEPKCDFYFTPAQLAHENGYNEITSYLNKEQTKKDIKSCLIGFIAITAVATSSFSNIICKKASNIARFFVKKNRDRDKTN